MKGFNKSDILNIDRAYIWHPFTQMKDYENREHIVIVKGKGAKLYDIDGNWYYDTISSWWTNILGHGNKKLNRAIKRQIKRLDHVNFSGFTHPYATSLIDELKDLLPTELKWFFFSDDGSTSVEVALKMVFQYWYNMGKKKKKAFVMLDNAYHGDTIGAISVGGVDVYHKVFSPLMFKTYRAKSPNCSRCKYRVKEFTYDAMNTGCKLQCLRSIKDILHKNKDEIAGVIVEPLLQGAGGMLVYPKEYLKALRDITAELDIPLIFDEVATGFGRTGSMFAMEKAGVVPDVVCLSKGLTGGYMPMSLTVATDKIFKAFYDDYEKGKTFFHGHSYTANPIACSVATQTMKILKEKRLPYSKEKVINYFHDRLKEFGEFDFVGDIRYIGFVGAIDIVKSRKKKEVFPASYRMGSKIYMHSLKNNLVLRPLGDVIYYFLPLIIKKRDIDFIIDRSKEVISEVVSK